MGLRDRLMAWLSRGELDLVDPAAVVQVAEVMLHDGPLLVHALHRAGLDAHGVEAFDFVTRTTTRMRILVRAADAERAMAVIRESGVRLQFPRP